MISPAATRPAPSRPTALGRLHPATRLAAVILGIAGALAVPPSWLPPLWLGLAVLLTWTGLSLRHQLLSLRSWSWVALLVIVTHTLTTTDAAPLGHPSLLGFMRGLQALLRVACTISWLALFLRVTALPDLVDGVGWWLTPLRRMGVPVQDLGLVLAVALGTVPQVLAESRRLDLVGRLRATGPVSPDPENPGHYLPPPRRNGLHRILDAVLRRARLVVPLMESLARRAEALTLSLRNRRPQPRAVGRPALWQMLSLAIWLAALIWLGGAAPGEPPW